MTASVLLLEPDQDLREAFEDERLRVVPCRVATELQAALDSGGGDVAVLDLPDEKDLLLPADGDNQAPVRIGDRIPSIILSTYDWTDHRTAEELGVVALIRQPADLDCVCSLVAQTASRVQQLREQQVALSKQASRSWARLAKTQDHIFETRALVRAVRISIANIRRQRG
jgi:DNA-binding NtrC family response regulator